MKKLIMFLLVHINPNAIFSQVSQYAICYHNTPACMCSSGKVVIRDTVYRRTPVKPDTLRAIILVTMSPNGLAHARMGYVVICEGKEVQYLDCRKRALKGSQMGWGYELIDPNYKQ